MSNRFISNIKYSYKILKPFELQLFYRDSIFAGTTLDKSHGFIHLCRDITQTKKIIWRYYQYESIKILQFPNDKLVGLKFEQNIPSRELYPHLYSPLTTRHINNIYSIDFDENQINMYEEKIKLLDKIIESSN